MVFANCFLVTPRAKEHFIRRSRETEGDRPLSLRLGIDLILLPWAFHLRRYHLTLRTLRNL
jgi:hypothetical protein